MSIHLKPDGSITTSPGRITLQALLCVAEEAVKAYASQHKPQQFTSPTVVGRWCCARFKGLPHEEFSVIWLNCQNQLLAVETLFRGTLDSCTVHPREVVKQAISHNAAAAILVHNHPSGCPEPSMADRTLTTKLKGALGVIDVRVLDHIVVGGDEWVSLAERGWL